MYKEQAVREPSLSRLKEIAKGLGLDVEETELQEYQSTLSKAPPINALIVSITKFSILIGSPRAYLSRNWRAITWVSDYRCPIGTFSNRTPVIAHCRNVRALGRVSYID